MSGLSATGFAKKTLSDIDQEVSDLLKQNFGNSINLQAPSVFAKLKGIWAERESLMWDLGQGVYDSQYPDTAIGVQLDNVVGLNGIRRLAATFSKQAQFLLFGTIGTVIPAGKIFSVQGNPTSRFVLDTAVTLIAGVDEVQNLAFSATPDAGSFALNLFGQVTNLINFNAAAIDVQNALNSLPALHTVVVTGTFGAGFVITFTATDGLQPQPLLQVETNTLTASSVAVVVTPSVTVPGVPQGQGTCTAESRGAFQATALTLTVIETPVAGLSSVINYVDAVVGREVETDQQLRLRRARTIQIGGNATIDAIRSKLLNLVGVSDAVPFENITMLPDGDGRPPKSYEFIVVGGADQDITQMIWDTKPGGIQTDGNQSGTAIDIAGQPQSVRWSRPTPVPIWLEADIIKDGSFPLDGQAQVEAAFLAYGQALGVGEDILVRIKLICAIDDIPGITDIVIRIGIAPSPTLDNNIIIAPNKIAVFDSGRITVTIL